MHYSFWGWANGKLACLSEIRDEVRCWNVVEDSFENCKFHLDDQEMGSAFLTHLTNEKLNHILSLCRCSLWWWRGSFRKRGACSIGRGRKRHLWPGVSVWLRAVRHESRGEQDDWVARPHQLQSHCQHGRFSHLPSQWFWRLDLGKADQSYCQNSANIGCALFSLFILTKNALICDVTHWRSLDVNPTQGSRCRTNTRCSIIIIMITLALLLHLLRGIIIMLYTLIAVFLLHLCGISALHLMLLFTVYRWSWSHVVNCIQLT